MYPAPASAAAMTIHNRTFHSRKPRCLTIRTAQKAPAAARVTALSTWVTRRKPLLRRYRLS